MKNRFLLLFVLLFSFAMPGVAQVKNTDAEKNEDIRQLMKMIGVDKLQQAFMDQMIDALKKTLPNQEEERFRNMSDRLMEIMRDEFKKSDFASIAFDLYNKYFTGDEIKGLIQFYASPLGQKALQVLPTVMQESATRGFELGQAAGERAISRWLDEFPELKKAVPQGTK